MGERKYWFSKNISQSAFERVERDLISQLGSQIVQALPREKRAKYAVKYALIRREIGSGQFPAQKKLWQNLVMPEETRWNLALCEVEEGNWKLLGEEIAKDAEKLKSTSNDVEAIMKGYVLEELSKLI